MIHSPQVQDFGCELCSEVGGKARQESAMIKERSGTSVSGIIGTGVNVTCLKPSQRHMAGGRVLVCDLPTNRSISKDETFCGEWPILLGYNFCHAENHTCYSSDRVHDHVKMIQCQSRTHTEQ